MATLTAGISASATLLPVSAEVEIGFYTIDSENIYVTGMSRGADGRSFTRRTASVDRAVGGSTAATHLSGATLTRYYPDAATAGGGGGVTVDNTVDAPAEVATIVAPGAAIVGDTATLPLGSILTDPGALWEADHAYVTGDRILVWDTVVFECQGDGLSGAIEPEWDTVEDLADNEITWNVLGEIGQLNNALMPLGLGLFALTSTSAIVVTAGEALTAHDDLEDAHVALHSVIADELAGHADPFVGAHGIYVGQVDPSAGAGVAAPISSLYRRDGVGQLWLKVDAPDTSWEQVTTA